MTELAACGYGGWDGRDRPTKTVFVSYIKQHGDFSFWNGIRIVRLADNPTPDNSFLFFFFFSHSLGASDRVPKSSCQYSTYLPNKKICYPVLDNVTMIGPVRALTRLVLHVYLTYRVAHSCSCASRDARGGDG